MPISPALFTSDDETWATPLDFYRMCHAEFDFDCDVAALAGSAKAEQWFGPDHPELGRRDAFANDWHGRCWMNPPYGRTIGTWMAKAAASAVDGATVVCLVPARTDTAWWHDHVMPYASEVRLVRGRLKFGSSVNSAPFPSALVIYRPDGNGGAPRLAAMGRS